MIRASIVLGECFELFLSSWAFFTLPFLVHKCRRNHIVLDKERKGHLKIHAEVEEFAGGTSGISEKDHPPPSPF
ncbi:hypothetical protein BJ742DRAFT_799543 [Cladochytrium replicatum]|nr:hypothetical protein BJ742DRAFT_799543 [Cladochytrium replicatum]